MVSVPFDDASVTSPPRTGEQPLLYCAGSALTLCFAYVLVVHAMRHGEIAVVAPFRYIFLIWAIVIQIVIFAVWPDFLTLLGSAILVATGIYTVYRERKVKGVGEVKLYRARRAEEGAEEADAGAGD